MQFGPTPRSFAIALSLASIPVAHAQFVQQGPKLVGTGAALPSFQGYSVAISNDGNTAVIGGTADNGATGAMWVFTRSGGVWSQQGLKLVGTGAIGNAQQGSSIALSADGNTALVGGSGDNSGEGAAWVFTRSGGVWTQQGPKLVGTGGAIFPPNQGVSAALSADGNTAIIGGPQDAAYVGAAWVFTRSGGVWTQQGPKLVGTGATGPLTMQGFGVALSADGDTAMVGALRDNNDTGAAWVFTRSGGVWTQQGSKLVGTGATGAAEQGRTVSLSADGNTAIVGGADDDGFRGAAWVFTRSGGVWTQQGPKLVGTGASGAAFQGFSVSLSSDGNLAIDGGPLDDNSGAGAAWIFARNGGVWTQLGAKLVGTGSSGTAQQGFSVSFAGDGHTAIIGGDQTSFGAGAAWIFSTTADLSISKTSSPGPVSAAASYSYTLLASNGGPSTAPAVTVSDSLPPGVTFGSVSGSGWSCGQAAGTVTCTLASLAIGAANPITINVTAPANGGTVTNTAAVSSNAVDPNPANDASTDILAVTPVADLSLSKSAAPAVNAGTPITYTLSVSNAGPSTASTLSLVDTLPAGVTFNGASGTGWSCAEAAGIVTCTMSSLAVGAASPVSVSVTAPLGGGTITNNASVSSATVDSNPTDNAASAGVTVIANADLSIVKTTSAQNAFVGLPLTYTLAVANAGPTIASSVTVTDVLPAGAAFVSAAGSGWTCGIGANTVTCTTPTLALGAAPAITLTITAPATTSSPSLANTATVNSATSDPVLANNSNTATVPLLSGGLIPALDGWALALLAGALVVIGSIGLRETR